MHAFPQSTHTAVWCAQQRTHEGHVHLSTCNLHADFPTGSIFHLQICNICSDSNTAATSSVAIWPDWNCLTSWSPPSPFKANLCVLVLHLNVIIVLKILHETRRWVGGKQQQSGTFVLKARLCPRIGDLHYAHTYGGIMAVSRPLLDSGRRLNLH